MQPSIAVRASRFEEGVCYFSLTCLTILPFAEAIARFFFKTGVPHSSVLMIHILLWVGLVSGMIATKQDKHLSIALIENFPHPLKQRIKKYCVLLSTVLAAFILTIVAWTAVAFVKISLTPWRLIGFIPDQVFALIIPVGYAIMALRYAGKIPVHPRILGMLTVLLATACSFPMIAKIIWGFDAPDAVFAITDAFYTLSWRIKLPVCLVLIIAAFAGTPLFVVLAGLSLILIHAARGEIDVVSNQIYTTLTMDSFIPIPLFTLTGFVLSESKAGKRLVRTFRSLFSFLPGGMIMATVVICAFFTSFTGASGVTILALGGLLYIILVDHVKYSPKFAIGLLTSTGSIGLLFPPSLPIILVGTATQTNIFHVFLGALFPGIILVITVIIFGISVSRKIKIPVEHFSFKKVAAALKASAFEILLPFLLIAGYFSGILSLTEIGAVALIYIIIVEVFIHKDIAVRDLPQVIGKAVPIIGGVLSILALSQALSYYIVDTQTPENFAHWMQETIKSKYVFLALLNGALLIVGCLMDIFSAILIVLPLIVPLGAAYGIDPVHLGIIFITNLEVGFLTPPVGMNLFLSAYRFNKPFIEICRDVLPFLIIQLIVVLLITYVPWFSTFLPSLF
ncbi:MAG: TRAP transporter large permease subunit [Spirochaetaceae bacterium]|jgi:tripartite ATP-independent transporter DctM subunit|nr:TRAP transporter large permease subunit [Spirochaetaceae bacterium]